MKNTDILKMSKREAILPRSIMGRIFIMSKERWINARKRGFTQIGNNVVNEREMTLQAKGLLLVLMSNSQDWKINMKEIMTRSKNGRDAHYKLIHELESFGFVKRVQLMLPSGNFGEVIYIFSDDEKEVEEATEELTKELRAEGQKFFIIKQKKQHLSPLPENPETVKKNNEPLPENPDTENPDTENQETYIIPKLENTKDNNTKLSMYVSSIIDYFISQFPDKATKYAQINLAEFVESYGHVLVENAIDRAVKGEASKPIGYIKGTLEKWSKAGVKTPEDIEKYEAAYKAKQQKKHNPSKQIQKDESKLPRSVANQLAKKEQPEKAPQHATIEDLEEKRARIQEKLKLMNERLEERQRSNKGQ